MFRACVTLWLLCLLSLIVVSCVKVKYVERNQLHYHITNHKWCAYAKLLMWSVTEVSSFRLLLIRRNTVPCPHCFGKPSCKDTEILWFPANSRGQGHWDLPVYRQGHLFEFVSVLFLSTHSNIVSIFFPEAITYSCFVDLMQRMNNNFPHGGAMDTHFANMRSLIQVRFFVVTLEPRYNEGLKHR